MRMKIIVLNFMFLLILTNCYSRRITAQEDSQTMQSIENPNEMSNYNKKRIENEEIKALYLLEKDNKETYNIIVKIIINNKSENINDYYYTVSSSNWKISDMLYELQISRQYFTPEKYEEIYNLSKDYIIKITEYAVYDYEALTNKYEGTPGGINNNCFSVLFNSEYGFIGTLAWE
jgi:hypothetical protein